MRRRYALFVLALLLAPYAGLAQSSADPRPWRARVTGRVLSAETGVPLARATVEISSTKLVTTAIPSVSRTATSDDNGAFEFAELPAGDFTLSVTRAGYHLAGSRRFSQAGFHRVSVQRQQTVEVTLAMNRGGAIAGRIVDEWGEPVAAVRVYALRYAYGTDGARAATSTGISDLTDDLGQFRVYGLPPGDYAVVAQGIRPSLDVAAGIIHAQGIRTAFNLATPAAPPPTYFPGTLSDAEAQVLSLGPGQEASVQFAMQSGRVARVSGTAFTSRGTPASGVVSMWTREGNLSPRREPVGVDGTFAFAGVPPGHYWVNVNNRVAGAGETSSIPITVGTDDVSGLSIVMSGGATIRGTVIFEGKRPPSRFPLTARFADGRSGPHGILGAAGFITAGADGRFETKDVIGRVTFTAVGDDWVVKSVTAGGAELLESGIDLDGKDVVDGIRITVTDKFASVAGRAVDADGKPLSDYLVALLRLDAVSHASPAIRALRTDDGGRFEAARLRPGSYVAGVVEDLEEGYHHSAQFQERLRELGRRFTVGEGEVVMLDLGVTPGL
jgi:hypothetical protein